MPDQTENAAPTLFGFALNRLVAFVGPYLSVLAGTIATWLVTNWPFLTDIFQTDANGIAGVISTVLVFVVTTAVVWLGQQKWLTGFQKWAYENQPNALPVIEHAVPGEYDPTEFEPVVGGIGQVGEGDEFAPVVPPGLGG